MWARCGTRLCQIRSRATNLNATRITNPFTDWMCTSGLTEWPSSHTSLCCRDSLLAFSYFSSLASAVLLLASAKIPTTCRRIGRISHRPWWSIHWRQLCGWQVSGSFASALTMTTASFLARITKRHIMVLEFTFRTTKRRWTLHLHGAICRFILVFSARRKSQMFHF